MVMMIYSFCNSKQGEIVMKKLNKIIVGISLATVLVFGVGATTQAEEVAKASTSEQPTTFSITSDPGVGGGH
jgi:hypothetical protein